MPSRPPFRISQDKLKKLGHHVGILDAQKPAAEKAEEAAPKHQGKWVAMFEGQNHFYTQRINQTVLSSLIGFALSDVCPLWRAAKATLEGIDYQGARVKFIKDFNTLEGTPSMPDGRPRSVYVESRYDSLDALSAEQLTQKKVPSFCALAKILGNQDIPPRNWGYTGKSIQETDAFFMSDIDLSGYYVPIRSGGLVDASRPELGEASDTLTSPLMFPKSEEYYFFTVKGPLESFNYNTPRVTVSGTSTPSKSLESVQEKLLEDAPRAQYFQLLFAAAALPDSWLDSLSARYLTATHHKAVHPQALVNRFKAHRDTLKANLQAELAKEDSPFQRLLATHRDEWIQQALAHAHKFNLHDCRKESHRAQRINLEELLANLKELAGLPRELGPGDQRLLDAGKAEGRDHFLRIKAKEYLQNLEGKARWTRKKLPDTAKKFLTQLEAPGPIDWSSWLGELDSKSQKAFGRRQETILAYRGLAQLIRVSDAQSRAEEAMSTGIRPETPVVGAGAGSPMMTSSPLGHRTNPLTGSGNSPQ
jgi:hypothetical protein